MNKNPFTVPFTKDVLNNPQDNGESIFKESILSKYNQVKTIGSFVDMDMKDIQPDVNSQKFEWNFEISSEHSKEDEEE
jgi:hypothetical protein